MCASIMWLRRACLSLMKKIAAGVLVLVSVFLFATTLKAALNPEVPVEVQPTATEQEHFVEMSPSLPVRLVIPSIGVDAAVQYVGKVAGGAMGTPHGFSDVGWYKYGAVPGADGNAVIDGHLDNGLGLSGVFKHLADLKPGDLVFVSTKASSTVTFRVVGSSLFDYSDPGTDAIFDQNISWSRLNLITCDGVWIPGAKTYGKRLVVFTERVNP